MPVTGNIASSQGWEPLLPCDMLSNGLALLLRLRLIISPWEALLPYGKVKILLSSAAGDIGPPASPALALCLPIPEKPQTSSKQVPRDGSTTF